MCSLRVTNIRLSVTDQSSIGSVAYRVMTNGIEVQAPKPLPTSGSPATHGFSLNLATLGLVASSIRVADTTTVEIIAVDQNGKKSTRALSFHFTLLPTPLFVSQTAPDSSVSLQGHTFSFASWSPTYRTGRSRSTRPGRTQPRQHGSQAVGVSNAVLQHARLRSKPEQLCAELTEAPGYGNLNSTPAVFVAGYAFEGAWPVAATHSHHRHALHIDCRHIIWSLVQKPGAFRRYRYRAEWPTFRRTHPILKFRAFGTFTTERTLGFPLPRHPAPGSDS